MKKIIGIISMIGLVFLDQIVKAIVVDKMALGDGFAIINGVLHMQYVRNTGAAWGIFPNSILFFIVFALFVSLGLMYIYIKLPLDKHFTILHWTMIVLIAGALGNLIDRIFRNYVVDFIYFKLIDFPVFNIADIYVTVSGIVLVILIMFYYKEEDFKFLNIKNQ